MSIESARKFYEKFREDENFRARIESCNDKELRLSIIREAGFDFNEYEIKQVMEEPQELDLDDLEAVAGGVGGDSSTGGTDSNSNSNSDDGDGSTASAAARV